MKKRLFLSLAALNFYMCFGQEGQGAEKTNNETILQSDLASIFDNLYNELTTIDLVTKEPVLYELIKVINQNIDTLKDELSDIEDSAKVQRHQEKIDIYKKLVESIDTPEKLESFLSKIRDSKSQYTLQDCDDLVQLYVLLFRSDEVTNIGLAGLEKIKVFYNQLNCVGSVDAISKW